MRPTRSRLNAITFVALFLATSAGCDTQVEPFIDEFEAPVHVVDGFLDGSTTEQRVRIQKLRRSEERPLPVLGEYDVSSVAVGDGGTVVWQDSIITLDDGTSAHQFSASFVPQPGVRYQLTVADDEAQTSVSTTVPEAPQLSTLVPSVTTVVVQPVALSGLIGPPPNLYVSYVVVEPEDGSRHTIDYTYTTPGRRRQTAWEFDVFLSADRMRIGSDLNRPASDTTLVLESVSVHFELFSPEWDQLDLPVRNPGFFASIGSFSIPVSIDPTLRDILRVK